MPTFNSTENGHKHLQTLAGERFLVIDDCNAEKILAFSTTRNLINLVAADIIYNFYTSPTQFTQLYILHTTVDDVMYPLVFTLLPGKSELIYDRLFKLLKTACQQRGLLHYYYIYAAMEAGGLARRKT